MKQDVWARRNRKVWVCRAQTEKWMSVFCWGSLLSPSLITGSDNKRKSDWKWFKQCWEAERCAKKEAGSGFIWCLVLAPQKKKNEYKNKKNIWAQSNNTRKAVLFYWTLQIIIFSQRYPVSAYMLIFIRLQLNEKQLRGNDSYVS